MSAKFNVLDQFQHTIHVLIAETLSIFVRSNPVLRGIKCRNEEIKLVQYADDTTVMFKDIKSAEHFLEYLNSFSVCSGLKINLEKTLGMRLGKRKNINVNLIGIKWPKDPIKLLGLFIRHNKNDIIVSNFRHKINKIRGLLFSWSKRNLTLIGRILIVKTLVIPKISFLCSLLLFPIEIINEIEKLIYCFIWKGNTHKVKKM